MEKSLAGWVHGQNLAEHSRARLEFMTSLFTDALAPSNFPFQPEAVKRFRETRGHSALDGLHHLWSNLRHNHGLPETVDKAPFKVGENIANTPGAVIFRNELVELIQYTPLQAQVAEAPVLFIPPQINKFYIFDLSPEKSVVRSVLEAGASQASHHQPAQPQRQSRRTGAWPKHAAAIDQSISAICDLIPAPAIVNPGRRLRRRQITWSGPASLRALRVAR